MMIALTRAVPPSIARCELTHLERQPIDAARAEAQHRRYEEALAELGCTVRRLPPAPELPDSVFVEDAAVVLDEVAVVTRPGAESRRGETPAVAAALREYRPVLEIQAPATVDGGDVLRLGRDLYVGLSARTSAEGLRQLQRLLRPWDYRVRGVEVRGCLHLKTAVTTIGEGAVLLNPAWVDAGAFGDLDRLEVDPREPMGANALVIGDVVLHPAAFPRTGERLERSGVRVRTVEADELGRAEGGLTCCSLIFAA